MLYRDRFADRGEPGFLVGLAHRHSLRRLVGVDQPGGRFELPGRASGDQCRKTELLDEHDTVMIGIIEHDRDCLTAPQYVIVSLGTPLPGEQAMPEPESIDTQLARGNRLAACDLDVGVGG